MSDEAVLIPELEGVTGLVFDLEGTLYVGDRPIDGAAASIAALRSSGIPMRFLTNTTTQAHDALTSKLERLGFEVGADEVFCAPTAAGRFLRDNDASAWLLVAPAALADFDGVRLDPDNPDYVVVGDLGDGWTFELLNRAFVLVRERGARLIGLVRSRYWLSADGTRLDAGPFVVALEYATGEFLPQRDEAFEAFRQFMKGQMTVGDATRRFKTLGLDDTLWLFESWAADLARCSAGGEVQDPETADMLGYLARSNPPWRAHQLLDRVRESRSAGVYNASPELEATQLLLAWRELMPRKRQTT